ncbi:hypothetical protein KI387_034501, partial [Taxus chinensis]
VGFVRGIFSARYSKIALMKTRSQICIPPVGITVTTPQLRRHEEFKRTQFVVNVFHPKQLHPEKPQIAEIVKARLHLPVESVIYLSKFQTVDSLSKGFGLAYDTAADAEKYEPPYKLKKMGVFVKKGKTTFKKDDRAKKIPYVQQKAFQKKKMMLRIGHIPF